MSAQKPVRPDRLERILRAMLAAALLCAVAWAWMDGSGPSTRTMF